MLFERTYEGCVAIIPLIVRLFGMGYGSILDIGRWIQYCGTLPMAG